MMSFGPLGGLVQRDRVVGRRRRVVLDADHQQRRGQPARGVDRPVDEDLLRRRQRDARRNAVVDVGLDRRGPALGGRDHDLLARVDQSARAGEHALSAVVIDAVEEGQPLMLRAHPMQPVGAVGDRHLADGGLDPLVARGEQHGVAAAGAAAAEDADRVGVDVVAGGQVRDRVDEIVT